MKKLLALLLVLMLSMSLFAGCGGNSEEPAETDDPVVSVEPEDEPEPEPEPEPEAEDGRIDAGNVSAICPDGWQSFPVMDEDDDTKADPNELKFFKGVEEGEEEFRNSKPSVAISYNARGPLGVDKEWHEGTDIDPIELGGRTFEGYTFERGGDTLVIMAAETDSEKIVVTIWLEIIKDRGISLDDADVREIIASIKVS